MKKGKSENNICVYDLDGTLDLTDGKLSAELYKMSKLGIAFVTATGRTNSYVRETCKKYGIYPPKFIIADNGGTIYDNRTNEYLKRRTLEVDKRRKILEEYIRLGGNLKEIRYTDGDNVFAVEATEVRKYYEAEGIIEYRTEEELIAEILGKDSDITKITLAGKKDLMKDIIQFVKENDIECWTDIGATKFPIGSRQNYRLDITDGETSKGEAVDFLVNYTGASTFTCIGNGPNDFSMFKFALDSDMPVIVVKNFEKGKITQESEEVAKKVQAYAEKIGRSGNVTIGSFPINGYIGRLEEIKNAKQRRAGFTNKLKVGAITKVDNSKKGSQGRIVRTGHRGNTR